MLLLSLGATGIGLLQPWVTRYIIDDGLLAGNFHLLVELCALMLGIALLSTLLGAVNRWLYVDLSARILLAMRSDLFAHLLTLSPAFHAEMPPGQLVARLDGDLAELQRFAVDSLLAAVNGAIALSGALLLMALLSPQLTLVALVLVPAVALFLRWSRPRVVDTTRRVRERASGITSFLVEKLGAVKLVQSAASASAERSRLDRLNDEFRRDTLRMQMTGYLVSHVPALATTLSTAVVFVSGGYLVIQGDMTLGAMIAFSAYLARSTGPVNTLLGLYVGWQRARVSLERVAEIRDRAPEVQAPADPLPMPDAGAATLVFDDVRFRYESRRSAVFSGLSFTVEAGSKVAVTGVSGSGKSTLVDLLHRHYDPQHGSISIGGIDLRRLSLDELRRKVAVVAQDTVLFGGTLGENIRYAVPGASREAVTQAVDAAGLAKLVASLPEGLDTDLGNRGVRLSGGQRQRLSICRALLADPAILVLDEATSAVDEATEAAVIEAIDALFPDRTRILVTHRPHTAAGCDRILRVTAEGTARFDD